MNDTTVRATDLYRALWMHAEGARGALFAAACLLFASQLVKLAVPWLAAQAIDALQVGGAAAFGTAARWIAAIFAVTVASWALHGPGRILERNVALRIRDRLTDRLVGRLLHAPLEWHEARHSGETLHRVERSSGALYDFAQSQFVYMQNAVSLVGPLVALCLLSVHTGAAAIAGYGLILWGVVRFDRSMMRLAGDENAAHRRLQAAQIDALGNIVSVFALKLRAATRERLRTRLAATFVPLRRMIVLNEAKWCTVDVLGAAVWCLLLALYVWTAHREAQALGAPLLLGGLFMVHQYAQQASGVVTSIASQYQGFARHRADYASAAPILEAPRENLQGDGDDTPRHAPEGSLPAAPLPRWRAMSIAGLHFVHASRHGPARPTLDDVDLRLQRGRRIALVGASGSGKSALLRVLAGLYAAGSADVRIDGSPADMARVAALATLIPQDAEVFEGTLRENLEMAGCTDDVQLLSAMHVVCMDDWLASLAGGLDTVLTERGGNLSGGQRQRIALARGLIAARGSSLLLLDEATSNLDPATEGRLLDRLTQDRHDACIVASVHRPALLARFDEVIRLEAGRVVERIVNAPAAG